MPASDSTLGPSRFASSFVQVEPGAALLAAEAIVARSVFAGPSLAIDEREAPIRREASAADAIHAAARLAARGERATVFLARREVLGALDAIDRAAASRLPVLVHVVPSAEDAALGRNELVPLLGGHAGVVVSSTGQEAVDMALALRRAAEDAETTFVHYCDAPAGAAPVALAGKDLVSHFLGSERRPSRQASDGDPRDNLAERRAHRAFAERVPFALAGALRELGELVTRPLAPLDRIDTHDAEELFVAIGTATPGVRSAVAALRREGRRVGAVGVRSLRPFFGAELVKLASRGRAVVVLEPFDAPLAPAGPVATSLKAAFADALTWAPGFPGVGRIPPIVSVLFATLPHGGVDEADLRAILAELAAGERARRLIVMGSERA